MMRITQVEARDGYTVYVKFDHGASGVVDLAHLAGKGVFRTWQDRQSFESVRVGDVGQLTWGNDIELCADALLQKLAPAPVSTN